MSAENFEQISFIPVPNPPWEEMDAFNDRTINQTKPWLDFIIETQGAKLVVLSVLAGQEKIGWFTGLIVKKFVYKILGSPFPGWTTSYLGFNLIDEKYRMPALLALPKWAFKNLSVQHIEIQDRRISPDKAKVHGLIFRTFTNYETDLSKGPDQVWKNMKGSVRTSIRKAQNENIIVENANSDPEFVQEYMKQLAEVFSKKGLKPSYNENRVRSLITHLVKADMILCVKASLPDKTPIATSIYPCFKDTMTFWGGASYRLYQIHQPNEAMHWFALNYWMERGATKCDYGGGGKYKIKYGVEEFQVAHIRFSKFKFLEWGRNIAKKVFKIFQKIKK